MNQTKIKSELVLASKNIETGDILYTFKFTYARFLLAEMNTHRMFSRNTASSRAIPSKKYRARVINDPFIPTYIGANQKGMQAGAELQGWRRKGVEAIIRSLRYVSVAAVWGMEKLGAHKQVANRYLEPWVWTEQIVSFTEVDNFLALRAHWMAEPHFQELAYQVKRQVTHVKECFRLWDFEAEDEIFGGTYHPYRQSNMQVLEEGDWHLPFIDEIDRANAEARAKAGNCVVDQLKIISTARCARVSYYLPEDGKRSTWEKDKQLHDRLVVRRDTQDMPMALAKWQVPETDPIHASPVEHQARAMHDSLFYANFRGFKQYRSEFPNESGAKK